MAIYRSPSFQEEKKYPVRPKVQEANIYNPPGKPSLVREIARRSGEVAGDIWNAPSVSEGVGTVARTIGRGYNELLGASPVEAPVQARKPVDVPEGATEIARGRMESDYTGPAAGFTKMTGDGLTTAVGPQGGSVAGVDRPGGSFVERPGVASDQPGYDALSNDEKIAANVAKYKQMGDLAQQSNVVRRATQYRALPANQRGRMPDDIADYLGKERTPYGQRAPSDPNAPVATQGDFWQKALKDYATGQVSTKGFEAIRKLKSDAESAGADQARDLMQQVNRLPAGRERREARRVAMSSLAARDPVGLPELPGAGKVARPETGARPQDQIDLAKYGLDVAKFRASEGREAAAAQLAQSREAREQFAADRETMGSMFEMGQMFQQQALEQIPEGIPAEIAPELARRAWQEAAGDPNAASQILQGLVQQVLQFEDADPEQIRSWLAGAL